MSGKTDFQKIKYQFTYGPLPFFSADVIATLEERSSRAGQDTVRVYCHWQADLTQYPMRARIAGTLCDLPRYKVAHALGRDFYLFQMPSFLHHVYSSDTNERSSADSLSGKEVQ